MHILQTVGGSFDQVAIAEAGGVTQSVARAQRHLIGDVVADGHAIVLEVKQRARGCGPAGFVIAEVERRASIGRTTADREIQLRSANVVPIEEDPFDPNWSLVGNTGGRAVDIKRLLG